VQKGPSDLIATNTTGPAASASESHVPDDASEALEELVEVDVEGGLKRCGGQGDILSGTIGAFLAWGKCHEDGAFGNKEVPTSRIPLLAAAAGSMVTRTASRIAFKREGRSVVTQDILGDVGSAFAEVFGEDMQGRDLKQASKY
jgi:ATP-dependent NAD(P)H-hydrate dehydratase